MVAIAGTRKFQARELPVRFKAHIESRVRQFSLVQRAGHAAGNARRRPRPRRWCITAHYDHLGIDPAMSGHNIYNGAVDNGTGCGILLELAHAFGASSARPPHPVLFVSVTAEEKGLLGSDYLGKHLPIPASQIALGSEFRRDQPIGVPESVNVTGARAHHLLSRWSSAPPRPSASTIQADPEPGAGHYYRSDHFSLARVGVPAFSVNTATQVRRTPAGMGQGAAR